MLFIERPDFVWGLIASMYLGNVVAVLLVLTTVPLYASILRVPFSIVGPVIVAIIFSGAYQIANSTFDMWLVLGFGVLGYLFKKLDYPIAPLVLAMVLGDKAEDAFRQSMLMSNGSLTIFWSNPLVAGIMALGLLMLAWPVIAKAVGLRGIRRRSAHYAFGQALTAKVTFTASKGSISMNHHEHFAGATTASRGVYRRHRWIWPQFPGAGPACSPDERTHRCGCRQRDSGGRAEIRRSGDRGRMQQQGRGQPLLG